LGLPICDHEGRPAGHDKKVVNGVRLHYVTAGTGEPLVLLHGIPKTLYYWRRLLPLLSPHYRVLAIDLRGFGYSDRPSSGFDMATMSEDVAQLTEELGFARFSVFGEDWGAAVAYQLAGAYPGRVRKLVFQEMLLPGFGLEERSFLTTQNVTSGRWLWHVNFYSVPDYPEALLTGQERLYFHMIRNESHDPSALPDDALEEYIGCYSTPGSLRCMFAVYRATLQDAEQNRNSAQARLQMPVLAVGGRHFLGEQVARHLTEVADDVQEVVLDGGHDLAMECPQTLAPIVLQFLGR
jgi:pimeloyl-ACP methyl ester carboxylesterase